MSGSRLFLLELQYRVSPPARPGVTHPALHPVLQSFRGAYVEHPWLAAGVVLGTRRVRFLAALTAVSGDE